MGNLIGSCGRASEGSVVKVIYWQGNTKILMGKRRLILAGEIMFEFPDSMVCDADRFFIGHEIPALLMDEQLMPGKTYLVLPLDIFSSETLSSSSVSAFVAYTPKQTQADLKESPLEYIKGSNGTTLIKVKPEYMVRQITRRGGHHDDKENEGKTSNSNSNSNSNSCVCSTAELKKEYEQLVGCKDQTWSPNLETISEAKKIRYSPYRFIGLEWEEKEDTLG